MTATRFDVNDLELRKSFLRHDAPHAINRLDETASPRWGRMRPQEMIEHLIWAFEISTGQADSRCFIPEAEWPRVRVFLSSNRPTPQGFANPALAGGLPPLLYESFAEAKAAFRRELARFLDAPHSAEPPRMHPIFGPIGYDEWHRAHYKHTYHHLLQFGLIEPEERAAPGTP